MLCVGITPKKQNQNESQPSLTLNSEKNEKESKKFKKNIKNKAFIISKKMNHFLKKIKSKRENNTKVTNNDYLIKKGIETNDYRNFLYYKLSKKYNSEKFTYNLKKINELIFNIPSKFTAYFKDFLLVEEDAEFLKREYEKKEFKKKFKKIFYFYEKYSKTFPNYSILSEGKYMYKNILKKQKMIDELQKMKEEEEVRTNSRFMDISSETIFTNNAIDSIVNQKDSFFIKDLEDIIFLDKQDEINNIQKINIIIGNINQAENLCKEKLDKTTKSKNQYKKIRNLSKPLHINQINPKLAQIKEKISKIKIHRNNYDLIKSKNNRTIEPSYNSLSTTINNKSFNNKGNIISNTVRTNLYQEKKEIFKKRTVCPKDLSYEKPNKKKLSNLSNKYQNNSNDKNQYDSRMSNSIVANKIKKYFKRDLNYLDKKKEVVNSHTKGQNSYNIGSLFNSRKDKCKEFQNDKKLISVFNKFINNRAKLLKKNMYLNTEITISQNSINNNKKDLMLLSQNNLYPNIYSTEIYDSKRFFEDNTNISKRKNYSLNKNNINININISQNSFLNHTFSSIVKYNKKDLNLNKNNNKNKKFKKNLKNLNNNKLFLKTKILKNSQNKSNAKSIALLNDNNKIKNFVEKSHLKTVYNIKNNDFSMNNTKASIGKIKFINQKKKNNNDKKIILSGGHYERNGKFINLKFASGFNFESNKSNRKKFIK